MTPTDAELKPFKMPPGASPFAEMMHFDGIWIGNGKGRIELTIADRHLRPLGIMHGGVLCTMLDSLLGLSCGSVAPRDHHVVTAQLNVNFIRPAWLGEKLIGTGEVQHAGKLTAVARGEVRTEKGLVVGSGSGTFVYIPHNDETRRVMKHFDDEEIRKARGQN